MSKGDQKQLQFAQSERNKVQSAYDALKKQWEEHFTTCGKGNKVLEFELCVHLMSYSVAKANIKFLINNLLKCVEVTFSNGEGRYFNL